MVLHATPTNITGLASIFQYTNTVTDSYMGLLILITLWFVAFFSLGAYPTEKGWTVASFLCLLVGAGLWALEMLALKFVVLAMLLLIIGVVWNIREQSPN